MNRAEDAVTEASAAALEENCLRDRGLSAVRNENSSIVLRKRGDGHVERRDAAVEEEFFPLRTGGRVHRYRRGRSFARGVVTAWGAFFREISRAKWIHEDGFPQEVAVRCVPIQDWLRHLSRREPDGGVGVPIQWQGP